MLDPMPFIVPFSGGCFSGKTTTMRDVQIILSKEYNCRIVEEPIRRLKIASIDELRKRPSEYLKMQLKITPARINHELSLRETAMPAIFLVDRAIADSMFYPLFYLNTEELNNRELVKAKDLFSLMQKSAQFLYNGVYNHVLFFKPMELACTDTKFRPTRIDVLKYIESDMILNLTRSFTGNFTVFNMNYQTAEEVANLILSKIQNHEIYKNKAR